jgi:hypothetical protein
MSLHRRNIPSERDLAAFADGSLPAAKRHQVEEALSASPELRSAVAAQQQVLGAIDAAARERAPSSLRARVRLVQPPPRRHRAARLGVVGVTSALAACAAAVVAVVLAVGSGTVAPTVAQAAVLTGQAPQAAVNEPATGHETLPGVRASGLTYPYWEDRFHYKATGVRYDGIGGRRITTVFYRHGPSRVAYEIVSGQPLRVGGKASSSQRQGVQLRAMHTHRGLLVTWQRDGHTCILIGAHTGLPALLSLAAWHQGGRVPY